MVQHVDNRLNAGDANEQLHEFQIVHAFITCRKNPSSDENVHNNNNNHNGYEQQEIDGNMNALKGRDSSPCEVRSTLVSTICRTFNALAQATNPSLAKQNISPHPVTIASTVKNIISQFSRPSNHTPICLASPCEQSPTKVSTAPAKSHKIRTNSKVSPTTSSSNRRPSSVRSSPSPTNNIKKGGTPESSPRQSNSNPRGASPKTKSVRTRNANRLTRHESAPIPQPTGKQEFSKTTVSVRRSKSDTSGYMSFYKRSQRKIDSNVQTKVLHFENCCKDKGRAAMCVECRKHSLEQDIAAQSRVSPVLLRADVAKIEEDNYVGALSYHKPSTIRQSPNPSDSVIKVTTSPCRPTVQGTPSDTSMRTAPATRLRAIACPGGTYYTSGVATQSSVSDPSPQRKCAKEMPEVNLLTEDVNPEFGEDNPIDLPHSVPTKDVVGCFSMKSKDYGVEARIGHDREVASSGHLVGASSSSEDSVMSDSSNHTDPSGDRPVTSFEDGCSHMKRKHSISDNDEMQNKKDNRDNGNTQPCNSRLADNHESFRPQLEIDVAPDVSLPPQVAVATSEHCEGKNLYSVLCNLKEDKSNSSTISTDSNISNNADGNVSDCSDNSELRFSTGEDSSDAMDSLSGDTCTSPRQAYLWGSCHSNGVRRTQSSRFKRMRRRVSRLFCRPQSYPQAGNSNPYPLMESQSEQEQLYLESIRIPAPYFMAKTKEKQSNFSARRQQLSLHFKPKDYMATLPDHIVATIFSYMDTRSLAMLKCVCKDFEFIIDTCDIRGTDSLWVKDERYIDDPCRFCRRKFTTGNVSMCRYHAKSYHCDLPYGRSYWMCCFQIEKDAPGCKTGIHNNHWGTNPSPKNGKKPRY